MFGQHSCLQCCLVQPSTAWMCPHKLSSGWCHQIRHYGTAWNSFKQWNVLKPLGMIPTGRALQMLWKSCISIALSSFRTFTYLIERNKQVKKWSECKESKWLPQVGGWVYYIVYMSLSKSSQNFFYRCLMIRLVDGNSWAWAFQEHQTSAPSVPLCKGQTKCWTKCEYCKYCVRYCEGKGKGRGVKLTSPFTS